MIDRQPQGWTGRAALIALMTLVGLGACASPGASLHSGMTQAELTRAWGAPTGRYVTSEGQRLEYASGPYGKSTWMIDLDAAGRAVAWQDVLTERHLRVVQGQLPGMSREQLLRTLGRPGEVRHGGWPGGQVWSWRFESVFCLWFQVSIGDDGVVRDGAFGPDPLCDVDNHSGSMGL